MRFDTGLVKLAEEYCDFYHGNDFRRSTNETYNVHPREVRDLLFRYGYRDTVTQCVALLHDTKEDTAVIIPELREVFGYEIANGVFITSKNTIKLDVIDGVWKYSGKPINGLDEETLYAIRLSFARRKIKRVKIADTTCNTKDLVNLKPESIEEKITMSENMFIPWGKEICPLMIRELEQNIANYRRKTGN